MSNIADNELLISRVEQLEQENVFWRSLLADMVWFSVAQTAKVLGVSSRTVYRLIDKKAIMHRYEGTKPLCQVESIRIYLTGKKIHPVEVNQRVITAGWIV